MSDYTSYLAELKIAEAKVSEIRSNINNAEDGFIYHIQICSYGSVSWETAKNPFYIQELCNEYFDGYNGLVYVYTNNTSLDLDHYGCLTIETLDRLPEDRKEVSKSQAFNDTITRGLGLKTQ
jgi:hypothetical protein